jgi:hypothetical protein
MRKTEGLGQEISLEVWKITEVILHGRVGKSFDLNYLLFGRTFSAALEQSPF